MSACTVSSSVTCSLKCRRRASCLSPASRESIVPQRLINHNQLRPCFKSSCSPRKNKHMLGTCCGVHCLLSQCALLALGLAGVNHMPRLFPRFSLAVLLLSSCYCRNPGLLAKEKKKALFLGMSLAHCVLACPEFSKFVLPCLETRF